MYNMLFSNNISKYHLSKINTQSTLQEQIIRDKNKDIDFKNIFERMLFRIDMMYEKKFKQYYFFLDEEESKRRYDIILCIKNFIIENNINRILFYYIINLFDILIIKNNKYKYFSSYEKIGLGALSISIKFFHESSANSVIKNKKYKSLYNNKYYSMKEVTKIELLCLKLINYNLIEPFLINFIQFFFVNKIIFKSEIDNNIFYNIEKCNHLYFLIFKNLEIIMINSNEYIKYNPFYISCFIIEFSRNILNMDKCIEIFYSYYNLTQIDFDYLYNEILSKFKNILNAYIKSNKKIKSRNINTSISKNNFMDLHIKSLSNIKKNLKYNFESLNSKNNIQNINYRNYENSVYLNKSSLDTKKSLRFIKEKRIKSNINNKKIENNDYSSEINQEKNIKESSLKKKPLNKIYTCLFEQYINSSLKHKYKNSLFKYKTSEYVKKSKNKESIKDNILKNNNNIILKINNNKKEKSVDNPTNKTESRLNYYKRNKIYNSKINFIIGNYDTNDEKLSRQINFEDEKIKDNYNKCISYTTRKKFEKEENEKEREQKEIKVNRNLISIRKSYKIKQNNGCYNIIVNRNNKNNIKNNEISNKNKEEENNKIFLFKNKNETNYEEKIINNNSNIGQNDNSNIIMNENNRKYINLNNKRSHIRMFYKLKNLKK